MRMAGERIRSYRGKVSLRQLAKDIGISPSYLSDVERDRRKITFEMAIRICATLFKYNGQQIYHQFDLILRAARLYTSERDCLLRLFEKSAGDYSFNTTLHQYRFEIYIGLYGQLDEAITGEKDGNRYEFWEEAG